MYHKIKLRVETGKHLGISNVNNLFPLQMCK